MNDKSNVSCQIFFGGEKIAEPASVEELEKFFTHIYGNFDPINPLFDVIHSSGSNLGVGISPTGCFVNYIDKSMDPPYYSSVGDRTLSQKDGLAQFFYGATYESEILRRNLIPFDDMLAVVKFFFQTGERPKEVIEWEID